MRRTVLVLSAVVLLSSGLSSPVAADSDVVVHGLDGFPQDELGNDLGSIALVGCDDPFERQVPSGPVIAYRLDDSAPLGSRAWELDAVEGDNTALGAYLVASPTGPGTVMTAQFKTEGTTTGVAYAGFVPDGGGASDYWAGFAHIPDLTGGWQTVSNADVVYHWRRYDFSAQTYVEEGGSATFAAFVADHGGGGFAEMVLAYGCDGGTFRTDSWTLGEPGSTTTFDLEGDLPQLSISRSKKVITAGQKVTITGGMTSVDGSPYSNTELELQQKTSDLPDFLPLDTFSTGEGDVPATATLRPTRTTAYRWFFGQTQCCDAASSPEVVVQVRTAVTGSLAKSKVRKGKSIVLKGRTTPAKPGEVVTLYRQTARGKKKLATAKVKADGRYTLSAKATSKGAWKVFAGVAADIDNLAGTSPVRRVKVT